MRRESHGDYLPSRNPDKRPRVRCDTFAIATKVSVSSFTATRSG